MRNQTPRCLPSPRRFRQTLIPVCLFFGISLLIWNKWPLSRNLLFPPTGRLDRNVHLDVSHVLTNELSQLLRQDISPVEDVGEAFMEQWFATEKEFCENVTTNKAYLFSTPECQATCVHQGRLVVPPSPGSTSAGRMLVVIPFRDRQSHLTKVVPRIREIMRAQRVCYMIAVVEQAGKESFNKGLLMNSAVVHMRQQFPSHCVMFHDVDLMPISNRVPYNCSHFPRHSSVRIDKFANRLPYTELIGGVLTMPIKAFLRVNGFSNLYWGWGAEDDDMYERLAANHIPITRSDPKVSEFRMLLHTPSPAFPIDLRSKILAFSRSRYRLDGINSLNFKLLEQTALVQPVNRSKAIQTAQTPREKSNLWVTRLLIDVGSAPLRSGDVGSVIDSAINKNDTPSANSSVRQTT